MEGGNDVVNIMAGSKIVGLVNGGAGTDTLNYNKVGLSDAKKSALLAGQTVNVGGTLYTSFELFGGTGNGVSFSSLATDSSTRSIAAILDNGSNTQSASAGLQTIIDQIASSSNVPAALAQLTPTSFQSITTMAVNAAFQTNQVLDQRLSNVRAGAMGFDISGIDALAMLAEGDRSRNLPPSGFAPPLQSDPITASGFAPVSGAVATPVPFAAMAASPGGKIVKAPVPAAQPERPASVFMYGNVTFGRQDAVGNAPANRFTTTGVTFGIDQHITPDLVLGVLGGFSRTRANLDDFGSTSKINTWLTGAYGTYYRGNWFTNGTFLYGRNTYDNSRMVLGTPNLSKPDGDQFAGQGAVGFDARYGQWLVTPTLGAQYTKVRVSGFTETGAAALVVGADSVDSFRTSLGVRTRYDLQTAWGVFVPEWRVTWQHEFLDSARNLRAGFVDSAFPGQFDTTTVGAGRDFGIFGAGISGKLGPDSTLSLNYDFKVGEHDYAAHQISGRIRHLF